MEQNRARWSDADQNQKILRKPEAGQKISKYSGSIRFKYIWENRDWVRLRSKT